MHLYVQLIDDIDVIAVADKMLFGTGIGMWGHHIMEQYTTHSVRIPNSIIGNSTRKA